MKCLTLARLSGREELVTDDEDAFNEQLGTWQIVSYEIQIVKPRSTPYDWSYKTLKSDPTYSSEVNGKKVFYPRLSYAGIIKGRAVKLYQASMRLIHPDERRHALLHKYFCRVFGCPYHPAY
jgi:hypothetical protein